MEIVALVGAAGCGKSTVAEILQGMGYHRLKFSQPLKDMLKAIGLTDEHTEGRLKEVPCDLLSGRTPRYAMQTLGTEWARDIMEKDFWLNLWRTQAQKYEKLVVEDCRFGNEAGLVKSMGGNLWRINRLGYGFNGHSSETEMEDLKCDLVINNHSNEADLKMMVIGLIGRVVPSWEGDVSENKLCIEKKQYVT
jgi:energy-coupling factor transporter ATP-binding protein EcfA2|tara:strand:- start:1768 stop:2346 length:579 start_codon:yes stop_codon:yes gene_type:complete